MGPRRHPRRPLPPARPDPDLSAFVVLYRADREDRSDNSWIRSKMSLPKAVAQYCGVFSVPHAFVVYKISAEGRADSEDIEEVLRYADAPQAFGFSTTGERVASIIKECEIGCQILEGLI